MSELMQDPMFWYSVAFILFMVIAVRYGRKPLLGWLDAEIVKIREELEEARRLRAEAEAMLKEYQAKQKVAMADAEAIVKNAREEATVLKANAETELQEAMNRYEHQVTERIRIAEAEAMAEVRGAVVEAAMAAVRKTLAAQIDDAAAAKLVDQAIADIPKLGAAKAKAA